MWAWKVAAQLVRAQPHIDLVRQQPPLPSIAFVRKRPFADLVLGYFDKGAPSNPKKMASVAQMMAQASEKDVRKVTRFIDEANADYHRPTGKLISARNAGSKRGNGGGKLSWAANGTAVQDLH